MGRGKGETQRVESRGARDERGEEHEGGAEIHSSGGKECEFGLLGLVVKCFLEYCLDGERWFEKMVGLLGGVIDLYLCMRMEKRVMMAKRGTMEARYDGSEL